MMGETASTAIHRQIFETRFGRMHVRWTEAGGRPLVALHMTPLSSRMWLPLMERLPRSVVAPDRLGFGCSDPPRGELSIEQYAVATLDTLDRLGIHEFDLLGEHTGSVEAVALAHLVPDRIARVGLIGIPSYTDLEVAHRLAARGSPPPPPAEDGSHLLAVWRRRLDSRDAPRDLELLHRLTVDELMSAGPEGAYRAVFGYPMAERLASLPLPVVVFAPDDDLAVQTRRAREGLPPGSTYVDLPDLRLDVFAMAADRMAELVSLHLGGGPGETP